MAPPQAPKRDVVWADVRISLASVYCELINTSLGTTWNCLCPRCHSPYLQITGPTPPLPCHVRQAPSHALPITLFPMPGHGPSQRGCIRPPCRLRQFPQTDKAFTRWERRCSLVKRRQELFPADGEVHDTCSHSHNVQLADLPVWGL